MSHVQWDSEVFIMQLILSFIRVLWNIVCAMIILVIVSIMVAVVSFALILGGRLGYEASTSIQSIWEQSNEIPAD